MSIPSLPQDKANHAFYGAGIAAVVSSVAILAHIPGAALIAAVVVTILAFGKEANDAWINYKATGDYMHGPHGVELNDALATMAGGAFVVIPQFVSLIG